MAPGLDSSALYQRCHSQDSRERVAAYQQIGEYLLRVAQARVQARPQFSELCEDCVQTALVTIWKKLEAKDGPDNPDHYLTWCTAILIHKQLDELRRWRRRQTSEPLQIGDETQDILPRALDQQMVSPDEQIVHSERKIELLLGVRSHPHLSDQSKTVVADGYLLELSDGELAAKLGTGRRNVQVIRTRNLAKLRQDEEFLAALRS